MSVPNQIPYNIYTANGQTTVFTYEFYIISASDLEVSINGSVVTSGYTVSGVGNKDGGDITFLTPPANGAVVMLERVVPTYRLTDYQDNGDLLADTVNKDFDRIWMAIQRAFIDLGLALTRPLFGGPFNAHSYRIENLADPVNSQDAATKKFVIENGKLNLARTLRAPELSIAPIPSVFGRKSKILAFNDQGNPIAVSPESGSAADVLIELASSDGEKLIGKCPHVGALRSIEPSYSDQTITLLRVVPGGPVVNLQLSYDADDTTSADDGYSVFVTTGGARWKADTSEGIDVRWAGLNLAGTNLGSCLNKIVQGELAKIIAADDYMAGVTNIRIKAKNHPKHNKKFVLEETVTLPGFFSIQATDFMTVSVLSDIDGWVITNNIPELIPSVTDFVNQQGTAVVDALSGRIETVGPGVSVSTHSGVKFGNTSGGSDVLDLRDTVLKNINVRGFDKGLHLFGWDTYINTVEYCNISGNNYNIYANGDKTNGGEKILFRSCVIANAAKSNVFWNTPLTDVTFDNTSIDYAQEHVFHFGELGRGNQIRLTNGTHVEGFGGMFIQSELSSIPSVSKGYFHVDASCRIDCAGVSQSAWAPRRQIIVDPNSNINIDIKCPIVFHGFSEPHVSLTGYQDNTGRFTRLSYECAASLYEECLSSYAHTLNSGLYQFSGTPGAIINSVDADAWTGYTFSKSDPAVVIAYGAVDSDGLQSISITMTSASQTVEILNPNLFAAIPFRARLYSAISVNIAGVNSGDVLISSRIASYLSDKATGLATQTGTPSGIVGQWNVPGTPLTKSDYLGIQTFIENGYQAQSSHLSRPSIQFTGWVGTIKIKLPAFWVQRGFGLGIPA